MSNIRKTIAAAIGVALAAAASVIAPAVAGVSPVEAPTVTVVHRDLDLSRSESRQTLDGRLRRAAISVCPRVGGVNAVEAQTARACQKQALESARREAAYAALKAEGRLAAR